jgi:glucose/arabinose dehydrogenase
VRRRALFYVALASLIVAAGLVLAPRGVMQSQQSPQLNRIALPNGFSVAIYADKVRDARSMTLAPDGTVFLGTRQNPGVVRAIVDRDRDYRADEVITLATGLHTPNGVAFKDGSLFVAELNRIVRFDGVLDVVKAPAASRRELKPVVLYDGLPSDRAHGWKYLAFGPDGLLYFQIGAPGNIVERPDPYATIVRMKPDGSGFEIVARGVRNSVGMDWHPDTRELWFTDNGRDQLGDEIPNDELNHAPRIGLHFGYPYCHEGSIVDPDLGSGKSCAGYAAPAQTLGPHVAALGMKFYLGSMFPQAYRKQILVAQHGSWNRTPQAGPIGYRIMLVRLQGNKVAGYEKFADGWLVNGEAWGRPVDLLELPDGSLLVSDDEADVIYRITYRN